jgi:hypothetical protein
LHMTCSAQAHLFEIPIPIDTFRPCPTATGKFTQDTNDATLV